MIFFHFTYLQNLKLGSPWTGYHQKNSFQTGKVTINTFWYTTLAVKGTKFLKQFFRWKEVSWLLLNVTVKSFKKYLLTFPRLAVTSKQIAFFFDWGNVSMHGIRKQIRNSHNFLRQICNNFVTQGLKILVLLFLLLKEIFELRQSFSTCVFKVITLVGLNQGNYFENSTTYSKRTPKTRVATQLKGWFQLLCKLQIIPIIYG
jgi:hypothetical protein